MSKMSLQDLQQEVEDYISQFREGYFQPLAMLARLTEEVGELAREVNHRFGPKKKKPEEKENTIENELGDLLFILICFANSLNIDLERAFHEVMNKYKVRDSHRWTQKEREGVRQHEYSNYCCGCNGKNGTRSGETHPTDGRIYISRCGFA